MSMYCRNCRQAKRYAPGSIFCVFFGIILREDHRCNHGRKIWDAKLFDYRTREREETGIPEDGGGAAGNMPGILPGPEEREGFPGVEGGEEWREG